MPKLSEQEQYCARVAIEVVTKAGGFISFDDYDAAMLRKMYFAPLGWCAGWESTALLKSNQDKLCAFAACIMGAMQQVNDGYRLVRS